MFRWGYKRRPINKDIPYIQSECLQKKIEQYDNDSVLIIEDVDDDREDAAEKDLGINKNTYKFHDESGYDDK